MTCRQYEWEHIEPMQAVEALYQACDELIQDYLGMEEKDVKPIFAKYDKDGSGAIDKDELAGMSAELGNPLDDEQLETALKDLDLNGDGVIDIDEFKRWYFSGMKSYSSTKRSMLKFAGGMKELATSFRDPELMAAIEAKPGSVKQKVKVAFNDAGDAPSTVEGSFSLLGEGYTELLAQANDFSQGSGLKKDSDDDKTLFAELRVNLPYKLGAPLAESFNKLVAINKDKLKDRENAFFALEADGDQLVLSILNYVPAYKAIKILPCIPEKLEAAFTETNNNIKVRLGFGTSVQQIAGSEGSIVDELVQGFSLEAELEYSKALKHILAKIRPLEQFAAMASPALQLGVDVDLKFSYDDIADVKEHPMLGQFANMKYGDVYNMLGLGEDLDYSSDISGLDESKFKGNDQQETIFQLLKLANQVGEALAQSKEESLEAKVMLEQSGHASLNLNLPGYPQLAQSAFNKATKGIREQFVGMLSQM